MRYLTTNYLKSLAAASITDGAGVAKTADSGFSVADLVDGLPENAWRAAAAAGSHTLVFDLGSAKTVKAFAIVDVESPTGVAVSSIALSTSVVSAIAGFANFPGGPNLTLNTRGAAVDGAICDSTGVSARWLKVVITMASSSKVDVGECGAGSYTDTARLHATERVSSDHPVVTNESQAHSVSSTKLGEEVLTFTLGWDMLETSAHAELLALKRAVGGQYSEWFMWPNETSVGEVYHGRMQAVLSWSADEPTLDGHVFIFQESGRSLPIS